MKARTRKREEEEEEEEEREEEEEEEDLVQVCSRSPSKGDIAGYPYDSYKISVGVSEIRRVN